MDTRAGHECGALVSTSNVTLANGDILTLSGNIDEIVGKTRCHRCGTGRPERLATYSVDARLYVGLYPFLHLAPDGRVFLSTVDKPAGQHVAQHKREWQLDRRRPPTRSATTAQEASCPDEGTVLVLRRRRPAAGVSGRHRSESGDTGLASGTIDVGRTPSAERDDSRGWHSAGEWWQQSTGILE